MSVKGFQDSKGDCLCVLTATRTHKTGEPGCYWEEKPMAVTVMDRFDLLHSLEGENFAIEKGYPTTWDESGPCLSTDEANLAEVAKAFPSMRVLPQGSVTFSLDIDKEPNMKVSITKKQTHKRPQRTLCYGEPGIGKSTFAADAPDVVFICTEAGADNLSVAHAHYEGRDPRTYDEVLAVLDGIPTDGSIKNVCIDTIDGLEGIIHAHIKTTTNKPVGEHGYGKGYDKALDLMRGVIASLERLRSSGVGCILLAHSTIENFANPEGADFSYVTIKAHKKITGLLVEWADAVLYAKREQRAFTNEDGKTIGVGSSKRQIHTEKTPTFVAKNRLRLPPVMALSWADYQKAIDDFKPLDAKALRVEATELASQFGPAAMAELEKLPDDAGDLLAFVEYCKGQLKAKEQNK